MHIQENVILAPYTTFHIGGPADFFVRVSSSAELIEAIKWASDPLFHVGRQLPFFVLGTGANILIGDNGFRGLVIKNEARSASLITNERNSLLTAESGAVVGDLIKLTVAEGLSGLEHFAGIPSTVGGALWQNLHFLSPDRTKTVFLGDIVDSAEILAESGEKKRVDKSYFHFDYDNSILHDTRDVVLSATFVLSSLSSNIIESRVRANILWRNEKHPENAAMCSAGSVFKKLEGYGAGRLIEQAGLKGRQIGGAQISEKHANFIINTGAANATDVRELISLVQKTVEEKFGLRLEPEISFVGDF